MELRRVPRRMLELLLGSNYGWNDTEGRGGSGVAFRHKSDGEICFSTVAKQLRPRVFNQHFQMYCFVCFFF